MNMYVLNNQSLDRKILETDQNLYLTFYEVDLYRQIYHEKKQKNVNNTIFPMEYLFRRISSDVMFRHNVHIKAGLELRSYHTKDHQNI